MTSSLRSEELKALLGKIYQKGATGFVSITVQDGARPVYGTLQVSEGQLLSAQFKNLTGRSALEQISSLEFPSISFARSNVTSPRDADIPDMTDVIDLSQIPAARVRAKAKAKLSDDQRRVNVNPSASASAPQRANNLSDLGWTNKLQTKMSVMLVVLSTLVLGGFALFNALSTRTRLESGLDTFTQTTASRLAKHLELPLWDVDGAAVGDSLEAEMLQENIAGIIVRDANSNAVFQGRQRNAAWEVANTVNSVAGDNIVSEQPIIRGDNEIGSVEVFVTKQFLGAQIRNTIIQDIVRLLLIDLALILITFFAFRRLLIRPILNLTAAADEISRGKVDASLGVTSRDEIGLLADALERMRSSLKLAIERMQAQKARS